MKTRIITLSILLAFFSVNIFAQNQSAASFVQSFYKFHRARWDAFTKNEVQVRKKWFTTELFELFQYELKREAEYLKEYPTNKPYFGDGFPFTPMEECYFKEKEIKNVLKIGKTSIKGNKSIVKVSFYYPKVCEGGLIHSYKIELVKNKNSWLINDLIYVDSGERLTKDLKRERY